MEFQPHNVALINQFIIMHKAAQTLYCLDFVTHAMHYSVNTKQH